jgi:ribosome-associated protein
MRKPPPDPDPTTDPSGEAARAGLEPRPSKTQLKRQMHELQRLGQDLVALPPAQLRRIELPELLREQIEAARQINSREALRRQLQYIGRLMRNADADSIRAQLAARSGARPVAQSVAQPAVLNRRPGAAR